MNTLRVSTIKILHLEDSELDAQLVRHMLEDDQFMFEVEWVDNFKDFQLALQNQVFDLILSDYSLPDCDGLKALMEAKTHAAHTPFILVTGALGEERAIDTIKAGVTDYILKSNLVRLKTAIPRAIEEAKTNLKSLETMEALRLSEERFDLAVRGSGAGIWDWEDVQQKKMWWSPRIYEMLGYEEGEIPSTRGQLYSMMPAEDAELLKIEMDKHFLERTPYDVEFRVLNKANQQVWLRSRGQAVYIDGQARRMAGYIQDISDRKRAQEALRARQRDLLQAQEVANIGCWTYDVKLDRLFWTPIVYRIYGFDAKDFDCTKAAELSRVHPDDLEKVEKLWAHGLKYGRVDYETRLLIDGQVRWVRQVAEIEFDEKGRPLKALGVVHDLTGQRKAEAERRQTDEQYKIITDSVHDSIVVIDLNGDVVFWNPASERIFGYKTDEIIGKNLHQLFFHADSRLDGCLCSVLTQVAQGEMEDSSVNLELVVLGKSGQNITVEMNASAIQQDGQWYGLGLIRDVTERRQLEEQLRQTQKMEAIGTLAGGIAHDFNNILASILGYSSMVERHLEKGSREKDDLKEVINAAERAKQLVRQILSFSRKSEIEKVPVYLDMVIKEVLRLIRASLPATIEVETHIQASGEAILGDATQIHQILMNLCTNAYHAMPGGGVLTLRLEKVALPTGSILPLEHGDYLELLVADTGHGIDPEVMGHIFDPYFTTKDVDTGTGLGLSVVRGIVDSLGGYIDVTSAPGEGACFRVLLPCCSNGQDINDAERSVELKGGRQNILVVDDEASLARMLKEFLDEIGYQATVETSSLDVLKMIEESPQKFDLVITDQTMPQMTGIELAQEICQLNASLPVLLCSGSKLSLATEGVDKTSICHVSLKTELLEELPSVLKEVFEND